MTCSLQREDDTDIERLTLFDAHPPHDDLRSEVLAGLQAEPKWLSPKWFYDAAGSQLFDAICEQPEYYPTRTELAILRDNASAIAAVCGRDSLLIEPGSGSGIKVRLLLDALQPRCYVPMDISRDHLFASAHRLAADYPWLRLHAICTDFQQFDTLPLPVEGRRIIFFPGSTIGNFEPAAAEQFLRRLRRLIGEDGGILIGVDTEKSETRLNAAYNDAQGVTAAFNLNLLNRINRELGADFDTAQFCHHAFYHPERRRIEMHLRSTQAQQVTIGDTTITFAAGETIHTENSCKYAPERFAELAAAADLQVSALWLDSERLFGLYYLTAAVA